jgi:2-octaprenyl-6-methoxyphenol hydroxylase
MKICILGNGLTALTLAKALTKQNIYVDVLHNIKNLNISKTRTIGISKSNIEFINKNVININKLVWKLNKIEIFSDNLNSEKLIDFKKDNDQIFSTVKNFKFYELLERDLYKDKYFKSKLISSKNLSFIKKYNLIINCDPLNIITKKFFNKNFIKKYNSNAYTTIISHKKIINNVAVQIFTKKGPLAFLPISNTQTSVVYSIPNNDNKTKENIEKLITNQNTKYEIKKIEKINNYALGFLNLRVYYYKNILAFGDLLHKIHPLAGQGFNMTIRDIKILLDIIKKKIDVGLPLDKTVGIEFQERTKHKNFIFSNGINLIHEFFNIERKIKNNLLSKTIQKFSNYPPINKMFTKIADRGVFF